MQLKSFLKDGLIQQLTIRWRIGQTLNVKLPTFQRPRLWVVPLNCIPIVNQFVIFQFAAVNLWYSHFRLLHTTVTVAVYLNSHKFSWTSSKKPNVSPHLGDKPFSKWTCRWLINKRKFEFSFKNFHQRDSFAVPSAVKATGMRLLQG